MKEVPVGMTIIAIVLLIFTIIVVAVCYADPSGTIDRQASTGGPIVNYPLMDAGGFAAPQTGTITGCVSVVRSAQSFAKSEWQLVIERWPIFEKYTEPCLYVDRTAANHEKVTWDVADLTFLPIDEDNAVLLYTLDGQEYIAWSTSHTVAACYGGTDKWWFGS